MNSEKLRSLAKELDKSVEKALRSQETLISRIDIVQKEVDSACLSSAEDPSEYTKKLRGVKTRISRIRDTIERVKLKLDRACGSDTKTQKPGKKIEAKSKA